MSAHKSAIVRLGEAEYQRLREAEEKLRLQVLDSKESFYDNDQASIYERMLVEGQKCDIKFNKIVHGLVDHFPDFSETQDEIAQWVQLQNEGFQKRLIRAEKDAVDWATQVTSELEQRGNLLEQKIIHRDHQLFEQKNDDFEDARRVIESATQLLEYLQIEYRFDLPSANELEVQRCEIEEAHRQFSAGRDDRSWIAARSAWNGLTRLRHLLEGQRAAYAACRVELISTAKRVLDRIQNNQVVQAMDADGNELTEQIEVDFWTEGAYLKLVEQAIQADSIVQQIEAADLNELSEWHEELDLLDERALDLITQARLAVLASQLRFNVAQIVVRALETQGFYLEEAAYHQNDFRASFMARTRSLSGSEVLVTIDPDPGLDEGGRVHIQSDDVQPVTEHELLLRNREIFNAIRQQGLDVGESKQNSSQPVQMPPVRSHLLQTEKKKDLSRRY